MANDSTSFFYWYRRYKVRAVDMTNFQNALVETARGLGEGVMGAAVLKGLEVTPSAGLSLSISPGIATAASGYLEVISSTVSLDVTNAATGTLPCRSLVVCTPSPTDANFINSPTAPFNQIPLNQLQKATIKLIPGTPASQPEYPAKGANDVVLCGLIVPPGQSSITTAMLDFEVRDSIGVNSLIAQNQVRFDNRLKPYRLSATTLGIKPSQNIGSGPVGFSYPGRLTPSKYPLNGGVFVAADSFVDFSTGVVSGGDGATPDFTPVIPFGSNSVICAVTLTQDDYLQFNFGTQGGFAQCLSSIHNQTFTGSGSLPAQDGNFPIAYVILTSYASSLSDIHVIDSRAFLGSGAAAAKFKSEIPTGTINGSQNVFTLSTVPSDVDSLFFYVDGNVLEKTDYTLVGKVVTITNSSFIPALGQSVYAKYLAYGAVTNTTPITNSGALFFSETPSGSVNGSNANFTLTNTPIDQNSVFFYVDENVLSNDDFTLSGMTVTITNPDFIPALGQSVYAKYLYVGLIPGGGGSGGTSGYATIGSRISPHAVDPTLGITPSSDPLQTWYLSSSLAGANLVSSTPQIAPGTKVGQKLILKIVNNTNYPVFQDANGLDINGLWPATGGNVMSQTIGLDWDGLYWSEDFRR